jgi:hypothetical protein
MAIFQQDITKNVKNKKKLSKEDKKIVKDIKRKEKEKQRQLALNEKNLKKRKKKSNSKKLGSERYSTVDGFKFTLSYAETNGRFASFLRLDNKYGSNRNMQYGWFINLIPEVNIKGVTATLITKDKLMDEDKQRKIIRDRAPGVINASSERGDIALTKETSGDVKIKEYRAEDFKRAQVKDAVQDSESIVDFEVYVKLTSDNADKIAQQIDNINTLYNENNKGIQISSVAGEQQKILESVLDPIAQSDTNNFTLMTGDYAGNDHMVRKGLNDVEDAVPVGLLTESYTRGIATMSINKRFNNDILIAAPDSDIIDYKYSKQLSSTSLWGQLVANDVMVHGHKVFHIVLNDFHYEPDYKGWIHVGEDDEGMPEYIWNERDYDEPQFVCPPVVGEELSHYDLSKGGLNSLEVFSSVEDGPQEKLDKTGQYFSANLKKNIYMMYLQSKRKITATQERTLRTLLINFYTKRDLWDSDAFENPYAARILDLDSSTVPTMNRFSTDLQTNQISAKNSTDDDKNTAAALYEILDDTLEANKQVFASKTTLPKPSEVQTHQNYYDLSGFDDRDLMESQFVNIFNYVSQAAKPEDVIMIHGVDGLSLETLEQIRDLLRKLKRKNVRMAYLFDRIGSGDVQKSKNFIERADVFNTNGYLYTNLERDFGFTIFGTMTDDELSKYEKSVRQILTETVKNALTDTKNRDQYQIRSGEGSSKSTVIVNSYFVI